MKGQALHIDELRARLRSREDELYLEFLRAESLSAGLYSLSAGTPDPQEPHNEDEVYYVVSGRASIDIDGDVRPVRSGSVIFVAKRVQHRFVDIEEDLEVLVLFAPAETV
jgi:mannose-6-phosphate isomerase-like protein (cupin superfamily)